MSFDEKTGQMDWKDESGWILLSIGSGLTLTTLYLFFHRFPDANSFAVALICCFAFYALSILLRIQNQRGRALTGRPAFNESKLKYVFPVLGFVIGIALLVLEQ